MGVSRVLGLDLAANRTGWSVVDLVDPKLPSRERCKWVAHGVIDLPNRRQVKTKPEGRAAWNLHRYQVLCTELQKVARLWQPDQTGYEVSVRPFRSHFGGKGRNATPGSEFQAAQGLGLAEGLLIAACGVVGLEPVAVPMPLAKQAATHVAKANGLQSKEQVARCLGLFYAFDVTGVGEDETDSAAICIALLDPPISLEDWMEKQKYGA